ncbi:MAG: ribonuclease HI [Desulfobacterales bacterium]|nr:ribonuclease HI [Desulfobacterales bacterium]
MAEKKKKFYAVAVGRMPGIYSQWFGDIGAHVQVSGFAGAVYKGFATYQEARAFMDSPPKAYRKRPDGKSGRTEKAATSKSKAKPQAKPSDGQGRIIIYTDGGARPTNPGPGGYGVVILEADHRRELSGGFRLTTNNRMELLACIKGLEALDAPSSVTIYSDSQYVVNAITKGWAAGWKRRGWVKSDRKPALNPDLWEQLLELCRKHDVAFVWVKGHAGTPENERCDTLATQAATGKGLPEDKGYSQAL